MTISIGTTRGITDGTVTDLIGTAVLIGMRGYGMTRGTTLGFTVGQGRGDGIILPIGMWHTGLTEA